MKRKEPTILIKIVFWVHFLFALISHMTVPIMLIGLARILFGLSSLDFWDASVVFGAGIFSLTYLANHITNSKNGFCALNELENVYREIEGLPPVGAFVPRFWTKVKQIYQGDIRSIP